MDTRATYDRIASHFSKTREYPWPEVEEFLGGRTSPRALDVGCGNGRHTELLTDRADLAVGIDLSHGLLAEAVTRARERGYVASFVHGDASRLPFADDSFGIGIYVATIHHLPSREARVRSLDELARVLSPDGVGLVSAWSTAHDAFADRFQDSSTGGESSGTGSEDPSTGGEGFIPGGDGSGTASEGLGIEAEEGFDTTVDWTLPGGETVPRFYHIYAPAELEADLGASDLVLEQLEISSGNCYAVVTPAPD